MNCFFCNTKELSQGPSDTWCICEICETNYFFDLNEHLATWYFGIEYKGYYYYVDWRLNNIEISRVTMDIEKIILGNEGRKIILNMPNHKIDQNIITPHNIISKLPIILTFL